VQLFHTASFEVRKLHLLPQELLIQLMSLILFSGVLCTTIIANLRTLLYKGDIQPIQPLRVAPPISLFACLVLPTEAFPSIHQLRIHHSSHLVCHRSAGHRISSGTLDIGQHQDFRFSHSFCIFSSGFLSLFSIDEIIYPKTHSRSHNTAFAFMPSFCFLRWFASCSALFCSTSISVVYSAMCLFLRVCVFFRTSRAM
jgi:hypothetical protein